MSLWDDIFGDDEETVDTEEAGSEDSYPADEDDYGYVDDSEKCTCHEPARLMTDEEASPGSVARGHAGATEENTFDEEEPWYGVLATLCAYDSAFETQNEGPGWIAGDSGGGGGSGTTLSFNANVVGALAAAFGTGSTASAASGAFAAGLGEAGDALASAVGGAVSGLW